MTNKDTYICLIFLNILIYYDTILLKQFQESQLKSFISLLLLSLTTKHFVGHLGFYLKAFISLSLHNLRTKTLFLNKMVDLFIYSTSLIQDIIKLVNTALAVRRYCRPSWISF